MRQTFILYNDTQLNILLQAKKLGFVSIIDARYYEHKYTKEFLFNIVSVKCSKNVMRGLEKVIDLFGPKEGISCEIILNDKFEITDLKDL